MPTTLTSARRFAQVATLIAASWPILATAQSESAQQSQSSARVQATSQAPSTAELIAQLKAHPGRPRVIVIMGRPGSGKGTVSKRLVKELGYEHVSTGDLLRATKGDPKYAEVQETMKRGGLVSSEVIMQLLADKLAKVDFKRGLILDGVPRTVDQVAPLERLLAAEGQEVDVALHLSVTEQTSTDRILKRAEQEKRSDDTAEAVAKRLEAFRKETQAAIDQFQAKSLMETADGNGTREEALDAVLLALLARADKRAPQISRQK